jgi:hypothetical protein
MLEMEGGAEFGTLRRIGRSNEFVLRIGRRLELSEKRMRFEGMERAVG